jgi:hypothetical protein
VRLVRVDKTRPGDLIVGTQAATWPTPRRITERNPAPEHSTTAPAYTLRFTTGEPRVLYGWVELQLAQRP